jgi:methylenetetrahydrofolate reductase (NADPH)
MKIETLLKEKERLLSFEFFPPKKQENEHILFETIEQLKDYEPDFVSVTYGAGGSTRDKTLDWTKLIKEKYALNVMMHLTCIATTKKKINEIINILIEYGIDNILALRGDIPEGINKESIITELKFANELVAFINKYNKFSIGVAGYPEGHAESDSIKKDIENLKKKIDAGADFIITQLFFDNKYFFNYLELLEKNNINVPVIAGIMPITNINQVLRFTQMCAVSVPKHIIDKMEGKSNSDMTKIGIDYAVLQCKELIENNVRGLHFYTLNKSIATKEILNKLQL